MQLIPSNGGAVDSDGHGLDVFQQKCKNKKTDHRRHKGLNNRVENSRQL